MPFRTYEKPAIPGNKRQALYPPETLANLQTTDLLSAFEVPRPYSFVARSRNDSPPVGGYGNGVDRLSVPFHYANRGDARQIPDPDCRVDGSRYCAAAVGRNRDCEHCFGMPVQRAQLVSSFEIPHANR